jgi:hypothetical protein
VVQRWLKRRSAREETCDKRIMVIVQLFNNNNKCAVAVIESISPEYDAERT